jgi:hypothetical protein
MSRASRPQERRRFLRSFASCLTLLLVPVASSGCFLLERLGKSSSSSPDAGHAIDAGVARDAGHVSTDTDAGMAPAPYVCPSDTTQCGDACVNLQTDFRHCGTCDTVCTVMPAACVGGACTCENNRIICAEKCVDPQTDDNNCGGCDLVCGPGANCQNGACVCTGGSCSCMNGLTSCSNICVDSQVDPTNCGACGMVCPTSGASETGCYLGTCGPAYEWSQWPAQGDSTMDSQYTISADDTTVSDAVTGLTWQENVSSSPCPSTVSGLCSWAQAVSYCQDLSLGSFATGWRLPTVIELQSIVDYAASSPAIDAHAFPGTPGIPFWTATPVESVPGDYIAIAFDTGSGSWQGPLALHAVRCVH